MTQSLAPDNQMHAPSAGQGGGPGRKWYVLALLVFLLCTAGVVAEVYGIILSFPKGTQFLVPGSVTITVESPGTYVLWDEVATFFENKRYLSSDELPGGMEIRISDAQADRTFSFSPSQGGTETNGSVKRRSLGDVYLDRPGVYVIGVSGNFAERVFYVRRSAVLTVLSGIAIVAALGLVGWVLAPISAIFIFFKRSAASNKAAQQAAEQPAEKGPGGASGMNAKEERTYAMFCHLGALSGFVVPFGNIIVPLILWALKKDASPFVDMHGRESLNFQISLLIYSFISAVLILVIIGVFLLAGLWIFNLVIVIIAGVRAESGEQFRYPLAIRFIK